MFAQLTGEDFWIVQMKCNLHVYAHKRRTKHATQISFKEQAAVAAARWNAGKSQRRKDIIVATKQRITSLIKNAWQELTSSNTKRELETCQQRPNRKA
jgi:hypothetical protein